MTSLVYVRWTKKTLCEWRKVPYLHLQAALNASRKIIKFKQENWKTAELHSRKQKTTTAPDVPAQKGAISSVFSTNPFKNIATNESLDPKLSGRIFFQRVESRRDTIGKCISENEVQFPPDRHSRFLENPFQELGSETEKLP